MPRVVLTQNLRRHGGGGPYEVTGQTVGEVLSSLFTQAPKLRSYLLDDQGAVRHHVVFFVDGEAIRDRASLGDTVGERSEIYVAQALSGG